MTGTSRTKGQTGQWLYKLGGVAVTAGVTIMVERLWHFRSALWRSLWNAYVSGRPLWLWVSTFWLAVLLMSGLLTWLWSPGAIQRARRLESDTHRPAFTFRLVATAILSLVPLIAAMLLASGGTIVDRDARVLFPQEPKIGPLSFATYGTNGRAWYVVHRESDAHGLSPTAYAEIHFEVYGDDVETNCGWVVYFVKGYDLSEYRSLRFLIRGETGDERLIIKAKDALGRERAFEISRQHLPEGRITAQWQEAVAPFDRFGNVDFSRIENISLASNGRLSGMTPQTVFVGRFHFAK